MILRRAVAASDVFRGCELDVGVVIPPARRNVGVFEIFLEEKSASGRWGALDREWRVPTLPLTRGDDQSRATCDRGHQARARYCRNCRAVGGPGDCTSGENV